MPTVNPVLPNDGEDADAVDISGPILAILSVLNGHIDQDNLEDGGVLINKLATSVANALVPVGAILPYGGASSPNSDWLLCYGQAVSRSTYSSLFAILSTSYGVGNGTTTFNLPDLRGRTVVGNDAMGGSAANRTQRSTTLTTTSGNASGTVGSATGLSIGMYITNANVTAGTTITAINGTTITMSANATGNGTNVASRFSLLANDAQVLGSAGGSDVHKLVTEQIASHSHQVGAPAAGGGSFSGYAMATSVSLYSNVNSTATSLAGGDQAHPNLQPSQTTNFIIKV